MGSQALRSRSPAVQAAAPSHFSSRVREAIEKGVVAVALGSDSAIGLSQVHGCRPIGTPAIVTRSEDRVIHELNGRPALEIFLEETGFADVTMDDGDFEALAVTHPLAQPELNRSERIRHILGRDGTSLVCATSVPENAAVMFTRETPEAVVATAGQGVSEALAVARRGSRPSGARLRLRRAQARRRGFALARGQRHPQRLPGPAAAACRPLHARRDRKDQRSERRPQPCPGRRRPRLIPRRRTRWTAMRRRFVEALRRAEIMALVNAASDT